MPAVEIERPTSVSATTVWTFVSDMDHWAPLLTAYQSHRQIDELHSVWTVKGELGGLSRVAEFDVAITEWIERDHIAFSLKGRDEPFAGRGAFHIVAASTGPATPETPGWWKRIRAGVARWLLGRVATLVEEATPIANGSPGCLLRCRLEVEASGGSGPIMNLLLGPILEAVAVDTATKIIAALEKEALS